MQKIAVIGMSCLFPGAHTPEQFIHNLNQGVDSTRPHGEAQMGADPALYYHPKKGQKDKYYSVRGGYITDFSFDATGFQLDPAVLQQLDDVYQWSLYVAREALRNGGYLTNAGQLQSCGVILGNLSFPTKHSNRLYLPIYFQAIETQLKKLLHSEAIGFRYSANGSEIHPDNRRISGFPSAVVAQALGLSEIFFSLDAACASSLYAVKLACDYLNAGKANLMLAGAVSAGDPFFINQGFSTFTAYSENGISCPLDQRSEGLVSGEGAGMLLLKRYEDALRDRDKIQAVISAIGLSNDGKGRSVLSPNSKGQLLAYERAYGESGIQPKQIDYIECHATGTHLGDLTELESLDRFFGKHQAAPLIGAVKANFGHLLTCAGMASMLKVILSMSQAEIPATINLEQPVASPNGVISGQQIVNTSRSWPRRATQRYGAVNAFGFGGTNAHLVFEEPIFHGKPDKQPEPISQPLAIVGMEACFGPFANLDAFDHAIYTGKQGFISLPEHRWKGVDQIDTLLENYGFSGRSVPSGAYLEHFSFDTLHYKIPPNELEAMMPQQMLMLKVADNALKDAGLREGSNVAVIVAMESDKTLHQFRGRIDLDWMMERVLQQLPTGLSEIDRELLKNLLQEAIRKPVQVNEFTSFIGNIMASRIAALWDFSGPAFTISAEDNSVYKALQVAQLLLDNREVEAVVVGAVDLAGNLEDVLLRNRYEEPYTSDNVCFGIEINARGWKVGEGAGAVVLKSVEKAKKDTNRCYATIDAISLSRESEAEAVVSSCRHALSQAQVSPGEIGLLEISGVKREEEIMKGLRVVFQNAPACGCALGSVTATIGHTYVASGMASLIKSALCLYHRYLPSIPGWNGPKPLAGWQNHPFYAVSESRYWPLTDSQKRVAAITGIGSDGSTAQLVLSESLSPQKRTNRHFQQESLFLFPLAADSKEEMVAELAVLSHVIDSSDDLYRLTCRHHAGGKLGKTYRAVLIGSGKESLQAEIKQAQSGIERAFTSKSDWQSPTGSYFTVDPFASEGNLAFVYPGAFNSYLGMGKDTFRLFPELLDVLSVYSSHPEKLLHDCLVFPRSLPVLTAKDYERLQRELEENVIPNFEAGISFAILKTALLRGAFGIQPRAAFGYSMGEVTMAFALGLWNSTDQMSRTLHHSPLFRGDLAGPMNTVRRAWNLPTCEIGSNDPLWASYLIQGPAAEIAQKLFGRERVYLLLIHSPREVIIGGAIRECERFIKELPYAVTPSVLPDVIHCPLVETNRQQIYEMQHSPVAPNPAIRFYSAAAYDQTAQSSHDLAENIATIYCKTLDFPRLVNKVYQDGSRIFLEIGPKGNCTRWIDEILGERKHVAVTVDNKGLSDEQALFRALAKLYSHGVPIDFSAVYPPQAGLAYQTKRPALIKLGGKSIPQAIVNPETSQRFRRLPLAKPLAVATQAVVPNVKARMEQELNDHRTQFSRNHSAFLTARDASLKLLREMVKLKIILVADQPVSLVTEQATVPFQGDPYLYPETRKPSASAESIWNEEDLLEFAGGKIAKVFGAEYELIDSYKYRVRLPLPPYLLVNRVTQLNAQRGEFKPSTLTTEYDVAKDAWFSVDGQIPWAIASEAGQCDLLLISYLGIDFQSKGERYYRLTDYTMTFFDELPKNGETLRYEIKIESFIRSGEALFFNFGYDCYVKNKMIYKMTGGRAGFISNAELAQGKGIVLSKAEEGQRRTIAKRRFTPLLPGRQTSFSRADLLNITKGRIAACLGDAYEQHGLNPSLRFAAEEILMVDRIVSIDLNGGPWGLGEVIAEKDLAPDHWYFPCHFKDDNVLAGTLVTEGCMQLLGFYMLYLGLQVNTRDARFQPIRNRPYAIRARGQIIPSDTRFSYKMELIEIGLEPRPFARANFYIILNGKILVDFRDLGVELLEKTEGDPAYRGHLPIQKPVAPPPLFGPEVIEEFATGSLAKCFGPEFAIYENRRGPRTPNRDLKLVSRIMVLKGEPNNFSVPSELVSEYDVPANAWFFTQNSFPVTPYSILMEIALQPCAFLSAYMGTTLIYPQLELCFRNLGATAELVQVPDLRGKTVVNRIRMVSVAKAAETVIMNFDFELLCDGTSFYRGTTQFGYYTPKALGMQKGLDRGEKQPPWYIANRIAKEAGISIDLRSTATGKRLYVAEPDRPHYRLAAGQLDFLDQALVFADSGRYSLGYVYASRQVNPADWFYPCHFFNDPVMPGSLGVEAILQAIKLFALQQKLGGEFRSPRFVHRPGVTSWLYRGQITPDNETMELEVHIKTIEQTPAHIVLTADANLWKNGLRIYEITDAAIALTGDNS